jgi:hypothetical protein
MLLSVKMALLTCASAFSVTDNCCDRSDRTGVFPCSCSAYWSTRHRRSWGRREERTISHPTVCRVLLCLTNAPPLPKSGGDVLRGGLRAGDGVQAIWQGVRLKWRGSGCSVWGKGTREREDEGRGQVSRLSGPIRVCSASPSSRRSD